MNNAYMMTLQAEYLASRDSKLLHDELCTAIFTMAQVTTKDICRKRNISLPKQKILTVAEDAVIMFMERYQKKAAWSVKTNYVSAIYYTCHHLLFDRRYKDRLQYSPMNASLCVTDNPDAEAERARIIATVQIASGYSDGIIRKAQKLKLWPPFLAYVATRHSLAWVNDHMADLRALWGIYH